MLVHIMLFKTDNFSLTIECTPIDFKPLLPEKPVETGEEGEETLLVVGDFVRFLEQKRTSIHSHADMHTCVCLVFSVILMVSIVH